VSTERIPRLRRDVAMPRRIANLPVDHRGYPIPWFVATLNDGTRDFRVADAEKRRRAMRFERCWVCGTPLQRDKAFVLGPMCAVNRVSAEPPSHPDCATYSALVCPFLATPTMRRRPLSADIDEMVSVPGESIDRNPGVTLVWVTRLYGLLPTPTGNLCHLAGTPVKTLWFAQGRPATRAEILASMESGYPLLDATCDRDPDPPTSRRHLAAAYERALALVPAQ
jgi:hypothetical protein